MLCNRNPIASRKTRNQIGDSHATCDHERAMDAATHTDELDRMRVIRTTKTTDNRKATAVLTAALADAVAEQRSVLDEISRHLAAGHDWHSKAIADARIDLDRVAHAICHLEIMLRAKE